MLMPQATSDSDCAPAMRFASTQWSLVLAARGDTSADGAAALAGLCDAYWQPLYGYVRRRGYSVEDAQDLTQEFFVRLLESHSIGRADPLLGKFRTFLLGALKHFLTDARRRTEAWKRGGGVQIISLDEA